MPLATQGLNYKYINHLETLSYNMITFKVLSYYTIKSTYFYTSSTQTHIC